MVAASGPAQPEPGSPGALNVHVGMSRDVEHITALEFRDDLRDAAGADAHRAVVRAREPVDLLFDPGQLQFTTGDGEIDDHDPQVPASGPGPPPQFGEDSRGRRAAHGSAEADGLSIRPLHRFDGQVMQRNVGTECHTPRGLDARSQGAEDQALDRLQRGREIALGHTGLPRRDGHEVVQRGDEPVECRVTR